MEPISIASGTLGVIFLTEGIKFLWNQAGKILDRYHEKKKQEEQGQKANMRELARIEEPAPEFMELSPVRSINFSKVEEKLGELKHLRKELSTYVLGDEAITPENTNMLAYVDQLQFVLSEIYSENVDVPLIKVKQFVKKIKKGAEVTGLDAELLTRGTFDIHQKIDTINGKLTGAKIKKTK